ncbi:MAG TPA: hypothetical protein VJ208_00775, partial [Candidatus Nanoarchaeia archaeon]|nr:hypothetical protein [Candidatus Nanoarchaeia archaeon]
MKGKILTIFGLSMFFLVLLVSGVSGVTFNADIVTANPTIVSSSFTPQLGSELIRGAESYIGRTTERSGVAYPGSDVIFWKITIDGPSTLTADMVDIDEMGYLDSPETVSHIETFHYPFTSDTNGKLIAVGSCDGNESVDSHNNSCTTLNGFSLDVDDIFHNADKIKFNSNAPLGTYNITYQLINKDTNAVSSGTYNVIFTLTIPTPTDNEIKQIICEYDGGTSANEGDLKVDIRDITVLNGYGKDKDWMLFDEVEVEIRVENNGDFDVDDIQLEWGIANDDLSNWAKEFKEIEEFNLKDGDEDIYTITFRVNEDDLDDFDDLNEISEKLSSGNYNLVVRATGIIDDSDNGPFDGDDTCSADFDGVSVDEQSDFVILD